MAPFDAADDPRLTRPSLLVRLRNPRDEDSWRQFVDIYTPLVLGFCRKRGLQEADAADLTQDVLGRVCQAIAKLDYDPRLGSFRGWLFTIVRNRLTDYHNGQRKVVGGSDAMRKLDATAEQNGDLEADWEREYRRHLFARAAQIVRRDIADVTWQAFHATSVEGRSPAEVAAQLKINIAAVYLAKSRVMSRLKAEIRLLDDTSEEDER